MRSVNPRQGEDFSDEEELKPDDLLADRYRLRRLIGRGGFSTVWAAEHVGTRKPVALKVLHRQGRDGAARFVREARIAARIDHPNVIRVHDVFQIEDDATLVMAMDLLEGESLATLRKRDGILSLHELSAIVIAIVDGLGAAHPLGVVHRDLKPENVFITSGGTIKILDFGIAKWVRPESEAALTPDLTETGSLVGTPHYMAPEQVFGERDVDDAADRWALGIIIYECMAGRRPIVGDNFGQVFKAIALGEITPLTTAAPDCPADVTSLVEALLSKERSTRPSLSAVRAVFERYVGPHDSQAASLVPANANANARSVAPEADTRPRGAAPSRWLVGGALFLVVGAASLGGVALRSNRGAVSLPPEPAPVARLSPVAASAASDPSVGDAPNDAPAAATATASGTPPPRTPLGVPTNTAKGTPVTAAPSVNASRPKTAPSSPSLPGRVHGTSPY